MKEKQKNNDVSITSITEKRDVLVTEFNQLQEKKRELERQLATLDENLLTIRGAVLVCNEFIESGDAPTQEGENV